MNEFIPPDVYGQLHIKYILMGFIYIPWLLYFRRMTLQSDSTTA